MTANRDSLAAVAGLSIADRVSAGIDLLDREVPGWDKGIDLDTFALDSCKRCVLGQLFRSFSLGLDDLGLDDADAVELGFDRHTHEDETVYVELTATWLAAIRARREVTS